MMQLSIIRGILRADEVSLRHKCILAKYLAGETCVCGNRKRSISWECQGCWEQQSAELLADNKKQCDAHMRSVARLLENNRANSSHAAKGE